MKWVLYAEYCTLIYSITNILFVALLLAKPYKGPFDKPLCCLLSKANIQESSTKHHYILGGKHNLLQKNMPKEIK